MLGKRPHPVIGRLSELFISSNQTSLFMDNISSSSSRSTLEHKILSPRGLKNYDLGGVGLGIVAALEKSSGRTLANRSDPIPVGSTNNSGRSNGEFEGMELEMESLEENYTYVTSHEINKSYTKVYYDSGEHGKISQVVGIVSMAKKFPSNFDMEVSDFLSSCHLCQKKLHGRDIYMYRGEKAFCSLDCRSRQIMADEHREKRRSEVVPISAEVSTSPSTSSPIFSTGILAI